MLLFLLTHIVASQDCCQQAADYAVAVQDADKAAKIARLAHAVGGGMQGHFMNISDNAEHDAELSDADSKKEEEEEDKGKKKDEPKDEESSKSEASDDSKSDDSESDDSKSSDSKSDDSRPEEKKSDNEEVKDGSETGPVVDANEASKVLDEGKTVVKTSLLEQPDSANGSPPHMEDEQELPTAEAAAFNTKATVNAMENDYSNERVAQLAYAIADSLGMGMTQVTVVR
ncbi:MAG: hypothetical protein LBF56_02690 [Holosporales bacterium]|jgi:hypothetical protein|nr:hypothetical protein [Holosporales bacterium]